MPPYRSPEAFKKALETRLGQGRALTTRRRLVVFERFLARASHVFATAVILKGGLALELRLARARTTRDVDLRLRGTPEEVLVKLQEAGRLDLGDFMRFEIRSDRTLEANGMPYSGHRYRAECQMGGRLFGEPFQVDVAFGEPFYGEPDVHPGHDWLGFAGIPAPQLRLYPVEAHIAEKLHAYSLPRSRANTRVKDLPDLALLGTVKVLQGQSLRVAIEQTFRLRGTHPLFSSLPDPSDGPGVNWTATYAAMAQENNLPWPTLPEVLVTVKAFLDPVLSGHPVSSWSPERWSWR
jgi:nucleotidyltransferase AbiEii toxin of type IV toxin-antitoxin system